MRRLGPLVAAFLMIGFGFAVYTTLGEQRTQVRAAATHRPEAAPAAFNLPGTLYVTQGGGLYRLRGGKFTQLQPPGGWMQPALSADGTRLIAVRRQLNLSDLVLMNADGQIQSQLTHNASPVTEVNRWAFYPRFAPGGSLFFSQDQPKVYDFRVDLAVWEVPQGSPITQARRWTSPNHYTGGDVSPQPLAGGGVVYAKYDVNEAGQSFSQIWETSGPGVPGSALTTPADDCGQPALSADGAALAMVCGSGAARQLVTATFDGQTLGPLQSLVPNQVVASPAWAPDGTGVVYFAPAATGTGEFQLWWMSTHGGQPRQVTTGLALDTTTPPAWGS